MKIELKKFAGEVLKYIYWLQVDEDQNNINNDDIRLGIKASKILIHKREAEQKDINKALNYLHIKKLIDRKTMLDGSSKLIKITEKGIDALDGDNYKRYFELTATPPFFKWGVKE